ncbi:MAG: recombination protein RecR [Planctomycetes bacterium]|nr:recombination protein RecR [Planctomycetota bacterium]
MARRPESVDVLIEALCQLPGIGAVTAERLASPLMAVPREEALGLAHAIKNVRDEVKVCSVCANLDQSDPCRFCDDPTRDRSIVLVVEGARDVAAFEATGYRGLYHVLQGRVSPLEGVKESDLTIGRLLKRLDDSLQEVCLATNPDLEGEATAHSVAALLTDRGVRVTRIARGIPAGAGITQVQQTILSDALEGRRELS